MCVYQHGNNKTIGMYLLGSQLARVRTTSTHKTLRYQINFVFVCHTIGNLKLLFNEIDEESLKSIVYLMPELELCKMHTLMESSVFLLLLLCSLAH